MISSIALVIYDLGSGGAERVVACLALALRPDFRTVVFMRQGGRAAGGTSIWPVCR